MRIQIISVRPKTWVGITAQFDPLKLSYKFCGEYLNQKSSQTLRRMMIQREILVSNDFVAKARSTTQSWIVGYSGGGDWSVGRRTGSTDGGLRVLPTDIALAFILIQHLDPKRRSILPDLLSRATKIPVHEALDAMKIESNHSYVMPSNVDISITDGHFGLTPRVMDHHK